MEIIIHIDQFKKCLFIKALFLLLFVFPIQQSNGQSKIDSLKKILAVTISDTAQIELKIKISRAYHREDIHNEDILMASQAVEQALPLNNNFLYARALDNLGLLYRYHQQYGDAIPLHKKAFDITEQEDIPPLNKMIFANNTGVASRYNSDYNTAVYYYLKALTLAERENDLKNIEISCNGLGNTLISIPNRADEALSYLERSLAIAKATKNKLGIAMNYLTISDYHGSKGQYATSRKYLNDLLQVNTELKDNFGMAMTYQSIGNSYLNENKNLNTAKSYFNKALHLFELLNDKLKQAYIYHSLGLIYFKESDLINGLKKFKESSKIAEELKNKRLIMQNAENIAQIYEALLDPKNALVHYKRSQLYKDSINLSEQETEIAAINNRYNFEKKESEIELLKKDKSLQDSQLTLNESKLKSRGTTIFLMSVSLICMLLLAFFQQRNRRIRIATEQQLQKQEKEKTQAVYEKNLMEAEMLATRMQVNPHFLFNCLNSIKYLIQSNQNKKATDYLVVFSRFIRMVLETSQKPLSTINEELELVRYYLTLEENRFNDNFSFSIENKIEEEFKDIFLPTLLLQPFVENAIWHGLLPSENERKTVQIKVSSHKLGTLISIDDNGVGRRTNTNRQHNSMGNKITHERIQLFNKNYADSIIWDIIDKTDEKGNPSGTCVNLIIHRNNILKTNHETAVKSPLNISLN